MNTILNLWASVQPWIYIVLGAVIIVVVIIAIRKAEASNPSYEEMRSDFDRLAAFGSSVHGGIERRSGNERRGEVK